jgi:hypothetical protein
MRRVGARLARFAAFVGGMILLLGIIVGGQGAAAGHHALTDHLAPYIPASALTAAALPLAATAAAAAAARMLGRRLRRPEDLPASWPFRARLLRLRAEIRPVRVELVLGRDSVAEPYEVARLADGLSAVLRSRRRLHVRRLLGPDSIVFEQRALAAERAVAFYVTCPARARDAVVARIRATYPGLRSRPAPPDAFLRHIDPPMKAGSSWLRRQPRSPVGVDVLRMKKRRRWIWSLQTTKDFTHSAVESVIHQLSVAGCDATLQLVLTPTPAIVEHLAGRALRRQERDLRAETGAGVEPGIESVTAQKDLKGALEGVGRAFYWFDWRILVPSGRIDTAAALTGALGELRQDNELVPRVMRLRRRLTAYRAAHGLRPAFASWWTGALSAAEVASAWHLPGVRLRDVDVRRQAARQLAAPAAISRDPHDALLVDECGPLGIRPVDRAKGLAVLGASGGGKSAVLLRYVGNVARDTSRALVIVDLKEDLARDALTVIPSSRRVHIIDLHRPYAGLNVLAIRDLAPEVRADILIAAMREIHGEESVGARSDSLLRAAITAVCVVEFRPTLSHVLRMLDPYDDGYRTWVTRELSFHHEVDFIRDFWCREFPAMCAANLRFVAEAVAAPRNKLQRFLAVPSLALATNNPCALDLVEIIRRRDVLVVNGSKAAVGEQNAALFCQLVVMLVQKALHQLQAVERHERGQAAIVIDEAHNVFTPSFATMLSEGRSGGAEVVAAFQYTAQVRDETVKAGIKSLLQNVSILRMRELEDARAYASLAMELFSDSIRIDPDDQRKLTIDPLDITNAPDYQVLNLWLADGAPQRAFHGRTIAIEPTVARMGGLDARAQHQDAQRSRGSHPHDDGAPIAPPLIWHADAVALSRHRTVFVDLTTWARRPADLTGHVQLVLGGTCFAARPSDPSGRRFEVDVPSDPLVDGHLPVGIYDVAIEAGPAGERVEWHPTVHVPAPEGRGKARVVPAQVELSERPRLAEAPA